MALIQYWKCDDNAATTVVVATVGTNGTFTGEATTSVRSSTGPGGLFLLSFDLDGTNDYVDILLSAPTFADAAAFSVSLWFTSDAQLDPLIGITAGSNSRIAFNSATGLGVTSTSVTSETYTTANISSGWHHILVARNTSNQTSAYVDGVASVSNPKTIGGTVIYNCFGRRNTVYHNGKIAGVKIFNSDETANVATLFAEGKPQNTVVPALTGTFQPSEVISTTDGTWSDGTSTYQWRKADDASGTNASNITAETSSTYTIDTGEIAVGKFLGVRVTNTNNIGTATADSLWTEVEAAPVSAANYKLGLGIGISL